MSQAVREYVITLTVKDAAQIIDDSLVEARLESTHYRNTDSYKAYKEAVEIMRQMCREQINEDPRKPEPAVLTLDNLKFVYYENAQIRKGLINGKYWE